MRTDSERLADILDAVQRIRRHVKVGDLHRFQQDEVLQSAVLRWFEIIGEASRGLTDQFRRSTRRSRGGKSATCETASRTATSTSTWISPGTRS